MTPKANENPFDDFIAVGRTVQQMIDYGYLEAPKTMNRYTITINHPAVKMVVTHKPAVDEMTAKLWALSLCGNVGVTTDDIKVKRHFWNPRRVQIAGWVGATLAAVAAFVISGMFQS